MEIRYLTVGVYPASHHLLEYARIPATGIILHRTVRFPHSVENLPREWGNEKNYRVPLSSSVTVFRMR